MQGGHKEVSTECFGRCLPQEPWMSLDGLRKRCGRAGLQGDHTEDLSLEEVSLIGKQTLLMG